MLRSSVVGGLSAATVAVVAWWVWGGGAAEPGAAPPVGAAPRTAIGNAPDLERGVANLDSRIDALAKALERERLRRSSLEREVDDLRRELALLDAGPSAPELDGRGATDPDARRAPTGSLDSDLLISAGFSEREVRSFERRLDEIEMASLRLRDQASREGWLATPRFAEEQAQLFEDRRATRSEYGDELYDWFLYASGRPNRVSVSEVIGGSPASEAGLETGDLIVRYAEDPILAPSDLRAATTSGDAGELTPVDVRRGNDTIRLYVPRGPLGVRIDATSARPEDAGNG